MAKSKFNNIEFAIKFYISHQAFVAETNMYAQRCNNEGGGLAQFLPMVRILPVRNKHRQLHAHMPAEFLLSLFWTKLSSNQRAANL